MPTQSRVHVNLTGFIAFFMLVHCGWCWLWFRVWGCMRVNYNEVWASLNFCLHGTAQIRSSEPKNELNHEMFFEIQNTSFYLLQVNEGSLDLFVREKEK